MEQEVCVFQYWNDMYETEAWFVTVEIHILYFKRKGNFARENKNLYESTLLNLQHLSNQNL